MEHIFSLFDYLTLTWFSHHFKRKGEARLVNFIGNFVNFSEFFSPQSKVKKFTDLCKDTK